MAHRAAGWVNRGTFTPFFWLLAALYLAHRGLAWLQFPRPDWVRFYVDDLLCLPLILTGTLFCLRGVYGPKVQFSKAQVVFVVAYVSVVFEAVLPHFMPRYTGDLLDVLCYAFGGWVFYRFLNRPLSAQ